MTRALGQRVAQRQCKTATSISSSRASRAISRDSARSSSRCRGIGGASDRWIGNGLGSLRRAKIPAARKPLPVGHEGTLRAMGTCVSPPPTLCILVVCFSGFKISCWKGKHFSSHVCIALGSIVTFTFGSNMSEDHSINT